MIHLTRINHVPITLNAELIEHIEVTPDTVITLINGGKFVVLESPEEVVDRAIAYRRAINTPSDLTTPAERQTPPQTIGMDD
jgi:flagellar protein FlbD